MPRIIYDNPVNTNSWDTQYYDLCKEAFGDNGKLGIEKLMEQDPTKKIEHFYVDNHGNPYDPHNHPSYEEDDYVCDITNKKLTRIDN